MDKIKKLLLAAAWYKKGGSTVSLINQIIALEESFLGYQEGPGGWTLFGQWYADNIAHDPAFATADWCEMFQTYCVYHCNVSGTVWPYVSPYGSAVNWMAQWMNARSYAINKISQMPRRGDVVAYSWTSDPANLDHVGMIVEVTGSTPGTAQLKVIEGNKSDTVGYRNIAYLDSQVCFVFRPPYHR